MNLLRRMCYYFGERFIKVGEILIFKANYKNDRPIYKKSLLRIAMEVIGDTIHDIGTNMVLFSSKLITRRKNKIAEGVKIEEVKKDRNFDESSRVLESMFKIPEASREKERQERKALIINMIDNEMKTNEEYYELLDRLVEHGDDELIEIAKACIARIEATTIIKGGCEVQTGCFRRVDCIKGE